MERRPATSTCDRVAVMTEGKLAGLLCRGVHELSVAAILRLAFRIEDALPDAPATKPVSLEEL